MKNRIAGCSLAFLTVATLSVTTLQDVSAKVDSIAEAYASQASRSLGRGEIWNAIRLYQQAIEQEQKDDNDELYIAKLHNDLGESYRRLADDKYQRQMSGLTVDECLENAENFLKQALVIKEATSHDRTDFIYIALSLENLALVYSARNKLSEAEALLRKALYIRETKEGKDGENSASTFLYLGDVLTKNSYFHEAEKNYSKAMSIYRRKDAVDSPIVGVCNQRLAIMYYQWNKLARAGEKYDLAITAFKKHLPSTERNLDKLKAELPNIGIESYGQALAELKQNSAKKPVPRDIQISLLKNFRAAARRTDSVDDVKYIDKKLRELGVQS